MDTSNDAIKNRLATNYTKPLTKKQEAEKERAEAIARLHEELKPGDTINCILRRRSASGMSRHISFVIAVEGGVRDITWLVARALKERINRDTGGIVVSGCGMDMGFHVVYNLGYVMFPKGVPCAGKGVCLSNDHNNGDRDCTKGKTHGDGGYAFRSNWL